MPVPLRSNTSVTGCEWSRSVSKRYSRLLAQPRAPRACRIAGMSQFALTSSHKLASTLSTHGRPLPPRAMDDEPPKRTSATRPRERLRAERANQCAPGAGARNEHRRSRWDAWQLAWARCRAFRCDYVFFCLPPSFLRSGARRTRRHMHPGIKSPPGLRCHSGLRLSRSLARISRQLALCTKQLNSCYILKNVLPSVCVTSRAV